MTLDELRRKIDAIDTELLRLLNERADVVHQVGEIKKRDGLQIYAPEREDSLLKSLVAKSEGRLPEASIRAIYREIMSAALALEEDLKIAYLGPPGTWTHQASIDKFGHSVKYLPQANLADVFDQVMNGQADYGVVPIESSAEGAAQHVFDLFAEFPLKICAQLIIPIEICLMASRPLEDLRRVCGHPGVLAQCRDWVARQPVHYEIGEVSSTQSAAEEAAEKSARTGAVGSPLAATLNDLTVVAGNIQNEDSRTRFVVVGRKPCPPTGDDLTSIIISGKVDTNSVMEALRVLGDLDLNVAHINSEMRSPGLGRYSFYVEVAGHGDDLPIDSAIRMLRDQGKTVTVLGSYPKPYDETPQQTDAEK